MSQASFRVTIVRHDLPRHLPGYIGIVMRDDDGRFYLGNVIEVEESEEHFAIGNRVELVRSTDDSGTESIHAEWSMADGPRNLRVNVIGAA